MKAIILVAGPSCVRYGFPIFAKPKCLYHYYGYLILEQNIRVLNASGIKDIRLVTGYNHRTIEQFCQKTPKKVEIVYNKDWKHDAVSSLLLGIENVTEDILLVCGDELLADVKEIKNTQYVKDIIACQAPLVYTTLEKPCGESIDEDYRGDRYYDICKISQEYLPVLRANAYQYKEKYTKKYQAYCGWNIRDGSGEALGFAILGLFRENKSSAGSVHKKELLPDLDIYWQTDEYQNGHVLLKFKSRFYYKLFDLLAKVKRRLKTVFEW